jgi:hypothetical protein
MVQDSVFVYAPLSELRLCVYTSLPSAGLGFRVQGSGFRIKGFGLMASGFSSLQGPYLSSGQREREAAQSWQRTT